VISSALCWRDTTSTLTVCCVYWYEIHLNCILNIHCNSQISNPFALYNSGNADNVNNLCRCWISYEVSYINTLCAYNAELLAMEGSGLYIYRGSINELILFSRSVPYSMSHWFPLIRCRLRDLRLTVSTDIVETFGIFKSLYVYIYIYAPRKTLRLTMNCIYDGDPIIR
jgi:hypothetical protein